MSLEFIIGNKWGKVNERPDRFEKRQEDGRLYIRGLCGILFLTVECWKWHEDEERNLREDTGEFGGQ